MSEATPPLPYPALRADHPANTGTVDPCVWRFIPGTLNLRGPQNFDEWAAAVARAETLLADSSRGYHHGVTVLHREGLQRLLDDRYCGTERIIYTEDVKRAALDAAREREATYWREWHESVFGPSARPI